jgi:hypothetical protein
MVHCSGCHSNFSVSGYTHHLRHTKSFACAAAYRAQLVEIEEDDNDIPAFSGDLFGNYEDDDEDEDRPNEGSSIMYILLPTYNCTDADEELFDIRPSVGCSPAQVPQPKVEPFPSARAGAPIPGSVCGACSSAAYGNRLGSDEEYVPFLSKLDWELARWAKLRSPSSTAVSELLEIDGVSFC